MMLAGDGTKFFVGRGVRGQGGIDGGRILLKEFRHPQERLTRIPAQILIAKFETLGGRDDPFSRHPRADMRQPLK